MFSPGGRGHACQSASPAFLTSSCLWVSTSMPGAKRNCGSRSVLSQASTVSPWASSGARAVRQSSGKSTAAGRFSLGFLLIEQGEFRPQTKGDRKDEGAILSLRISTEEG